MITLKRYIEPPPEERTGMPPGTWHAREVHPEWKGPEFKGSDGKGYWITVCCPECKCQCSLVTQNHTVASDGKVSPSLVCPNSKCTWHVFVRLEGWPP